jgi:hypothetical protein
MNGSSLLPSLETLKTQAKRLRVDLDAGGQKIGHGRSLELLAHQHGYKDWNTFHAAIDNQTPSCPVMVGQRVRGAYLGQLFQGVVTGIQSLTHADRFRVTLSFDEPVDVVTFESFSNFRSRVSCVIDRDGETLEKTSNGQPQLRLQF